MSKTYLVAVDGSESSLAAVRLACQRAVADDADLILLSVIEWSGFTVLTPEELEERHRTREAEIQKAREEFIEPALAVSKETGVEAEVIIRHGHLDETIASVVQENEVTRVFIGRHGHFTWEERLLGSGLIEILKRSPVPVTVVP